VGNKQDATPSPSTHRVGRLTEREHQVAQLIAQGLKDAAVARRLGISASTVAVYIGHIKQRLRLATRAEIATWVTARPHPNDPAGRLRQADQARTADPHRDIRAS
jgi:DNA-binding NarL/FixJ family response regulator